MKRGGAAILYHSIVGAGGLKKASCRKRQAPKNNSEGESRREDERRAI